MSTTDTTWYVGPSGGLVAIPDLESATRHRDKIQSVTTGATGARTVNTTGFRRSWSLTVEGLTRHLQGLLHSLDQGVIAGPLYLVDPLQVNMYESRVASTFSAYGVYPAFTPAALGVQVNPIASDATFPISPRHRFFARAENTSGSSSTVAIGSWTPVVTSTLHTFSVYLKAGSVLLPTFTVEGRTAAGVVSTVSTANPAATTSWIRSNFSFTPGPTIAEVRIKFSLANATVMDLCAPQLERGTLSDWTPGDGVRQVQLIDMPEEDPYWFYGNYVLNFVEL